MPKNEFICLISVINEADKSEMRQKSHTLSQNPNVFDCFISFFLLLKGQYPMHFSLLHRFHGTCFSASCFSHLLLSYHPKQDMIAVGVKNKMKEKRCREIYEEVTEQCQNKSELSACAVWSIPYNGITIKTPLSLFLGQRRFCLIYFILHKPRIISASDSSTEPQERRHCLSSRCILPPSMQQFP